MNLNQQNSEEEYRDVVGYEELYKISSYGNILSKAKKTGGAVKGIVKERPKAHHSNGKGYRYTSLCKDGKKKNKYVHRLVAEAFLLNPEGLSEVNHKDSNTENNRLENLEWIGRSGNMKHCYKNGKREMTPWHKEQLAKGRRKHRRTKGNSK